MKTTIALLLLLFTCNNRSITENQVLFPLKLEQDKIVTGAEQLDKYINLLKNKRVAMMVNHSSLVGKTHLVDTLTTLGIKIKTILATEHGFRGEREAGEYFDTYIDNKTGIKVISLYQKKKMPDSLDLADIDIVVYDIQDIGVRFFTYISSMYLLMKACALYNKPLIILDRPNPNGDYVAGPLLDTTKCLSFVGMLPIPVVYGLTHAELANMINGENWLKTKQKCNLTIVKCLNYKHKYRFEPPVRPSPNLPNYLSIRLYPSLCLFEATSISIGRGTQFPFQMIGYPDQRFGKFVFTPAEIKGMSSNPIHKDKACYGEDLRNITDTPKFTLKFIFDYYQKCQNLNIEFFKSTRWFDLLIGNETTREMLLKGIDYKEIEKSWTEDIEKYNKTRQKYLLYE